MALSPPQASPEATAPPLSPSAASLTLLSIPGDSPEATDSYWLEHVYQGDRLPQLTLRSVLLGAAIGLVTCATNLYVGLKTGIVFGVAITAVLLAQGAHGLFRRLVPGVAGAPLSPLETCNAQAVASAAGYATGGALVSVQGAWLVVTGHHPSGPMLLAWTFFLSALGVLFAVPFKRQLVDHEQLPFASGTAAATTIRAMHGTDSEASSRLRLLGGGGLFSGLVTLARDAWGMLPVSVPLPGTWRGHTLERLGFGLELSLLPIGAGVLLGPRITTSMLLGAVLIHGVVAPRVFASGVVDAKEGSYLEWSLWPGTAALVVGSLLHFLLQGRVVGRALRGVLSRAPGRPHPVDALQVPRSWLLTGLVVLTPASVAVAYVGFGVPVAHGALAVAMSFALCLISCRVTGETDSTPVGALGQVTQVTYGVLLPNQVQANLATAGITVNTASSSADLLTDLKTGHLLGAHPRRLFLAQLIGSGIGALAVVPLFFLLVPNAEALGGERFPAPGVFSTAGVARILASGLDSLPPMTRAAVGWASLLAALLVLAERLLPARWGRWIPSPLGMGLACLLPASYALGFFLGGVISGVVSYVKSTTAEGRVVTLAAGCIAGEGLVGVAIVLSQSLW